MRFFFFKLTGGQEAQPSTFRVMTTIQGQEVLAGDGGGGGDEWIEMPTQTVGVRELTALVL